MSVRRIHSDGEQVLILNDHDWSGAKRLAAAYVNLREMVLESGAEFGACVTAALADIERIEEETCATRRAGALRRRWGVICGLADAPAPFTDSIKAAIYISTKQVEGTIISGAKINKDDTP